MLDLGVLAEQTGSSAARRLPAGELDQHVDAGPRDASNDGAVMRSDPALHR